MGSGMMGGGDLPALSVVVVGWLYESMGVVFLFIVPLLSMRLLAEERRNRTLELLLTSPVSSTEIVVGKFLGSLAFFAAFLVLSATVPILLHRIAGLDPGVVGTTYLGALLFGGACLAIGLFTSSLTQHQLVAAVLSITLSLVLWLASMMVGPGESVSIASQIFSYLSILEHYQAFTGGNLKLEGIVYFLSLITFFLFATVQRLETLRHQ
jgi:ABC-2 type transport system permease protein